MAKKNPDQAPVLVVLIGWARNYDGTEAIVGGHGYLQDNPDDNGEIQAFVRQSDGYFRCGAGKGEIHEEKVDIVFIARNPLNSFYEVVALYHASDWEVDPKSWCTVQTKRVQLFPFGKRPLCSVWPVGQGMRRWAYRVKSKGRVHKELSDIYKVALKGPRRSIGATPPDTDPELLAFEGEQKKRFVLHRKREAKLRAAKIRQALRAGKGHLVCEVPNCGFNFLETYGEDGRNYAVVHHTRPLSWVHINGARTSLAELAIVCANCHAIIHRGGGCRKMASLIQNQCELGDIRGVCS